MKVLLSTGIGRLHLIETAIALQQAGFEVRVLTGVTPGRIPRKLVDAAGRFLLSREDMYDRLALRVRAPLRPEQVISCPLGELMEGSRSFALSRGWSSRLVPSAASVWRLYGWESRRHVRDADVVHLRSGAGLGGVRERARAWGMKIVTDHSIAHPFWMDRVLAEEARHWPGERRDSSRDTFWNGVLKDCEEADVIVVNSKFVRDSFVQEGFSPERIEVVSWPIEADFTLDSVRAPMKSQDEPLRLVFTGNFGLRKGARVLLEALEILRQERFAYQLEVFGEWSETSCILSRYNLDHVIFHGSVLRDRLRKELLRADLYVFPTFAEGCARSVVEAMALGLPIITTRESGAPIKDRVSGRLVERGSSEALASAIREAWQQPEERVAWGRAARQFVTDYLTPEAYSRRLASVYQRLSP